MAENKGIEGIAGALGKAGAAMIDQSQGTSFYKDALDREKEERARQFALEQLAAKKKELDAENARNGMGALITAFGNEMTGAMRNSDTTSAGEVGILDAKGQALQSRILGDPSLSQMDQEIFLTQLSGYGTAMGSLGESAAINDVAKSGDIMGGYIGLPQHLRMKAKTTSATIANEVLQGEQTFNSLLGMDMGTEALMTTFSDLEVIKKVQESGATSYEQLADKDLALAKRLAALDTDKIYTQRAKSSFTRTQLEPDRKKWMGNMRLPGPLRELITEEGATAAFKDVFSPENLIATEKGVMYIKKPEEVVRELMRPVQTIVESIGNLDTLLQLDRYSKEMDGKFPNMGFGGIVEDRIATAVQAHTPVDLTAMIQEQKELQMDNISEQLDFILGNEPLVIPLPEGFDSSDYDGELAVRTALAMFGEESYKKDGESFLKLQALETKTEQVEFIRNRKNWQGVDAEALLLPAYHGNGPTPETIRDAFTAAYHGTGPQAIMNARLLQIQDMATGAQAVLGKGLTSKLGNEYGSLAGELASGNPAIQRSLLNYMQMSLEKGGDPQKAMRAVLGQGTDLTRELQGQGFVTSSEKPSVDQLLAFFSDNYYEASAMSKGTVPKDRTPEILHATNSFKELLSTMGGYFGEGEEMDADREHLRIMFNMGDPGDEESLSIEHELAFMLSEIIL